MRSFIAFLILGVGVAPAALAQMEGKTFDHLHEQKRVGNLVCMTDHWHYGEGGPLKDRRVAEQMARRKWTEFTIMEYGKAWGTFERAGGRRVECKVTKDGAASLYTCGAHGRPCRPAR